MKKYLLLTAMTAACGVLPMLAAELTPDEAMQRALGDAPHRVAPLSRTELVLTHTELMPSSDAPSFYVFNRPDDGGFIIASADDCVPALLGVVDKGSFDYDRLPGNVKWWLGEYSRQIEWAVDNGVRALPLDSDAQPRREQQATIEKLVSTEWNQDAPFNLLCPEYNGQHAVTGCVATAMAQVINYHKWPQEHGNGTNTYRWKGKDISYDYSTATFDWDNMLDKYTSDATEAQQMAVANLMLACGVSVNMRYSPDESGAFTDIITYALKEFFGFDEAASNALRDMYTKAQWEDMVYKELAAGRPVLFGGSNGQAGHEFVCDGYESGYFHINWGWGGYYDGMFLLSALNPEGTGIGGGAGSFNFDQSIVIGVGRPGEVNDFTPVSPIIASCAPTCTKSEAYDDGYLLTIEFNNGGMFNRSRYEIAGTIGVGIASELGEIDSYSESGDFTFPGMNVDNGNFAGIGGYVAYVPAPANPGTVYVYPAFREEGGEWERVSVLATASQCVALTFAEDGTVTVSPGPALVEPTLEITGFGNDQGYFVSGEPTNLNITLRNGDESFSGIIALYAYPELSDEVIHVDNFALQVLPGIEGTFSTEYTINLPAGMYDFAFESELGVVLSPKFKIEVKELILATSLTLEPTVVEAVEGDEFTITATIEPENVTEKSLFWSSSNSDVAEVDENGHVKVLKEGHATIYAETMDGSGLVATCAVTSTSAISLVNADDLLWDVVTPEGVVLRTNLTKDQIAALAPGVYILRNGDRAIKYAVK